MFKIGVTRPGSVMRRPAPRRRPLRKVIHRNSSLIAYHITDYLISWKLQLPPPEGSYAITPHHPASYNEKLPSN